MTEEYDDPEECYFEECRFYDSVKKEYGYAVICWRESHADRDHCPGEHEMFRVLKRNHVVPPDIPPST